MRVAGTYELQYNAFTPKTVHKYIHARVEALWRLLNRKIGDTHYMHVNTSKNSEACYLSIRNKQYNTKYVVSFRNHGDFTNNGQRYDRSILLSRYETWSECKEDFMTNLLPQILHETDVLRPLAEDIRKEINKAIDEAALTVDLPLLIASEIEKELTAIDELHTIVYKEMQRAMDETIGTI